MKQTRVISGFPGVGKSYLFNNFRGKYILDSDSSCFSWMINDNGDKVRNPDFPNNYIKHINENIGKVDIIMVSSHDITRKALEENNITYELVYPNIKLKNEYIERYRKRGNDEKFIEFISSSWDTFINDIKNEKFPALIELQSGQFLKDVI